MVSGKINQKLLSGTLAMLCAGSAQVALAQNNAAPNLRPAIPGKSTDPNSLQYPLPATNNPKSKSKQPYSAAIKLQEMNTPLSDHPVDRVAPAGSQSPSATESFADSASENTVELKRPPLQALISVEGSLNPFTLDAGRIEEVSLRDILRAAEGSNLDILDTRYGTNAQKYTYLAAASNFLPTANLGFNEFGVNARIPVPISAVTQASAGSATPITAKTSETKIRTGITQLTSGVTLNIYKASLLSTLLAEKHQLKAARAQLRSTINDTLLNAARDYYTLVLNQALLQIRTLAVERSQEQFRNNTALLSSGLATNLDVLQARAQLARDNQNLVEQQKNRRNSAIMLGHLLNANLGQDLLPADQFLRKVRLMSKQLNVGELLTIAIDNRPELKQYDELRKVAKANILQASAPLQPNAFVTGNIYGVGENLANLGPVYLINFGVKWTFGGLGLTDFNNIQSSKWRARQAVVEAHQQFLNIIDQVRTTFNESLSSERRIDQAIDEIAAAQEELRLARIRLDTGLGINIDVLNAQRDLTQAYIDKAQAISDFNIAQVRLLHDIGLVTVDNLTSGRLITAPGAPKT